MNDVAINRANDLSGLTGLLAPIWERVLRRSPISHHDSFLDLGGDSRLAAALFREIERVTGRSLPTAALYDAPTIATLAALLDQSSRPRSSPLVLLKAGTGNPLFIVHGLGGHVMELFPLGRRIPSQRPIYAIRPKGLDGADAPFESIAEMAGHYVDNIKGMQPSGPYLLAGYSFGGVIAFEMAHQLSKAGEKVALLALLDSYTHPRHWPLTSRIGVLRRRIANRISIAAKTPIRQTFAYYVGRVGDVSRKLRKYGISRGPLGFQSEELSPEVERVQECCNVAWIRYRPHFYPGKITFLRAGTNIAFPKDATRIWRGLAKEFEVISVPGHHVELVTQNVQPLADRLSLCIEEALGPESPE